MNRLVKRDKAGRFQLCLESNWWKETHQKFDAVKGKDKALGYTLTRAKAACGGQEGLDKALSTGEVRQVTENGTTFHVFKAGFVFFPFRSLLCFLLHAMQEIMVSHEKGTRSETSCAGQTEPGSAGVQGLRAGLRLEPPAADLCPAQRPSWKQLRHSGSRSERPGLSRFELVVLISGSHPFFHSCQDKKNLD